MYTTGDIDIPERRVRWNDSVGTINRKRWSGLWFTYYFTADGATEGTWINEGSYRRVKANPYRGDNR